MELDNKEKEYMAYIDEHISNVQNAYLKYGETLCKLLNISPFDLFEKVAIHDQSKYSEEEFDAYRNYFYPCTDEKRNKEEFDIAWKHHYENNPHHPEYWKGKDMCNIAIAEMLLDWEAMSVKFHGNTYDYYLKERDNKGFSDNTKHILDKIVKEVFGVDK